MKEPKTNNLGEEIVEIFKGTKKIIANFLKHGADKVVKLWVKKIEEWTEKAKDEKLLRVVESFKDWRDKEELKKIIEKLGERHEYYLKRDLIRKNIFIAHNHGDPFAKEVETFLFKEKFNPIIMQEQPHTGKTIIDKFKGIGFGTAIILLKEDPKLTEETKISQAKPNVILELGYCYGYLESISDVIIMHDEKAHIPSNIGSVEYIKIDENWRYNLSNSLEARGIKE